MSKKSILLDRFKAKCIEKLKSLQRENTDREANHVEADTILYELLT